MSDVSDRDYRIAVWMLALSISFALGAVCTEILRALGL